MKIFCTDVAALMSSWWDCGLWEWCFINLIVQVSWKMQNWSAAQYCILALLIISCSQTDHRLSGLPNKMVQMQPRGSGGLYVLMLFFHIPKHRWEQENTQPWFLRHFRNDDWEERGKDTRGTKANLKVHTEFQICCTDSWTSIDFYRNLLYWKSVCDSSLQQTAIKVHLFF